jgi:hypothetical protein
LFGRRRVAIAKQREAATEETSRERDASADDARRPYQAPELVDCGDAASLTQTAFVTAGTDSGYS